MQFGDEIQQLLHNSADKQATNAVDASGQSERSQGPRLQHTQAAEYEAGTLMNQVASRIMSP